MTFVSHSQNFEDVILWRALGHVQNGYYLDVGAQDPELHSVSLAFYQHGWRGVHIEPTLQYSEKLRTARPDELVLQVALGRKEGVLTLFEIADTGLSTLNSQIAETHRIQGFEAKHTSVPVMTLDAVLALHGKQDVHWLKVDVEGAEKEVLEGWRLSTIRPWIVVIEATLPLSTCTTHHEWEDLILQKGYQFAYFDGLNRFYVSDAHQYLLEKFQSPPNVFDQFVLSENHHLCNQEGNHESRSARIIRRYVETTRQLEMQSLHMEKKFMELEEHCKQLNIHLAGTQASQQELISTLTAVRSSASWRVTSPIRWISTQIRLLKAQGIRARWLALARKFKGSAGLDKHMAHNDRMQPMQDDQHSALPMSTRERAIYESVIESIKDTGKKS